MCLYMTRKEIKLAHQKYKVRQLCTPVPYFNHRNAPIVSGQNIYCGFTVDTEKYLEIHTEYPVCE